MPIEETALAILVPEAEGLVGAFRDDYDPSAALGMPAHVTLLYPFVAAAATDAAMHDRLRGCFARAAPFDFALTEARRFPDRVFYLAVKPEAPFRCLTWAIWQLFPEAPPYGGRYPTIVPHLTIADRQQAARLADIDRRFARAAEGMLPIRARASEVALLDARSGRWQVGTTFRLG